MRVIIIDYGMGNLQSIVNALEQCGAGPEISDDPRDIIQAEALILPGVGAFADGMKNVQSSGLDLAIKEAATVRRIPILGICLGMQLLADRGFEGGEIPGLGLVTGEVRKLQPDNRDERIPHVGWNEVYYTRADPLVSAIPKGSDFYFVHSYHFMPHDQGDVVGITPYCTTIVSIVRHDTVWGVQFHPEKSSILGLTLLKNFLDICEGARSC
jgi:glutamine amidotransferase